MYDSFDILPILNWHNYLKTNDFKYLLEDKNKKLSENGLIKGYEILIDSLGERKLLNGYYAKCLQSRIVFLATKGPKDEQTYNDDFFNYLRLLNENIEVYNIFNVVFYDSREAYNHYYRINGHLQSLEMRVIDFHFGNFELKKYDFDLFKDLAVMEAFLHRAIDPQTTSVNHYNAIKKQAIKQSESVKHK